MFNNKAAGVALVKEVRPKSVDEIRRRDQALAKEMIAKVAGETLEGVIEPGIYQLLFESVWLARSKKVTINRKRLDSVAAFKAYLDDILHKKDLTAIEGVVEALVLPTQKRNSKNQMIVEDPHRTMLAIEPMMLILQSLGSTGAKLRFSPSNISGMGSVTDSGTKIFGSGQSENNAIFSIFRMIGLIARQYRVVRYDHFADSQKTAEFVINAVQDIQSLINTILRLPNALDKDQRAEFAKVTPFLNLVTSFASFTISTLGNGTPEEVYESVKKSLIHNTPYVIDASLRGVFALHSLGKIPVGMIDKVSIGNLATVPAVTILKNIASEVVYQIESKRHHRQHTEAKYDLVHESEDVVEMAAKIDEFYRELNQSLLSQPGSPTIDALIVECHRLRMLSRHQYQKEIDQLRKSVAETGSDMQTFAKRRNVQRVIDTLDGAINITSMFIPPVQLATVVTASLSLSMKLFGIPVIKRESKANFNLKVFDNTLILSNKASAMRSLIELPRTSSPNIVLMDSVVRAGYYKGSYNKRKKYFKRNNEKIVANIAKKASGYANFLLALPHDIVPLKINIRKSSRQKAHKKRANENNKALKMWCRSPIKRLLARIHIRSAYRKWMQNADVLIALNKHLNDDQGSLDLYANIRNYDSIRESMVKGGAELADSIRRYIKKNENDVRNSYYKDYAKHIDHALKYKFGLMRAQPSIDERIEKTIYHGKRKSAIEGYVRKRIGEISEQMDAVRIIHDNIVSYADQYKVIANRQMMLDDFDNQISEVSDFLDRYSKEISNEQKEMYLEKIKNLTTRAQSLRSEVEKHDENVEEKKREFVTENANEAGFLIDQPLKKVHVATGMKRRRAATQQSVVIDPGVYHITYRYTLKRLINDTVADIKKNPGQRDVLLIGLIPYDKKVDEETHTLKAVRDRLVGLSRSIRFVVTLHKRLEKEGNDHQLQNITKVMRDFKKQSKLMLKRYDVLVAKQDRPEVTPKAKKIGEVFAKFVIKLSMVTRKIGDAVMRSRLKYSRRELSSQLSQLRVISGYDIFHQPSNERHDLLGRVKELRNSIEKEILWAASDSQRKAYYEKMLYDLRKIQSSLAKRGEKLTRFMFDRVSEAFERLVIGFKSTSAEVAHDVDGARDVTGADDRAVLNTLGDILKALTKANLTLTAAAADTELSPPRPINPLGSDFSFSGSYHGHFHRGENSGAKDLRRRRTLDDDSQSKLLKDLSNTNSKRK